MRTAQENESSRVAWVQAALDRFEGPLLRYAARMTGNADLARDVVQDTFLRLCSAKRSRVDGRLAGWLFTVCRNRALDVMRKERRGVSAGGAELDAQEGVGVPASVQIERQETEGAVSRAVSALPEHQQEVIRLKFQDGMSYREISQVTGLSVSNVGYLIHHGIRNIRRALGESDGTEAAQEIGHEDGD